MKTSSKKDKTSSSFRLSTHLSEGIQELIKKKPLIFSKIRIVETALSHFFSLSEEKQVELMEKYLTKQMESSRKG